MLDQWKEIEKLKLTLASLETQESLERDPYWPKWNSPWWQMSLLYEMGLSAKTPASAVQKLVEVLKIHYHKEFPLRAEEIPKGLDPSRQLACHCAVANISQVLFSCGVDLQEELPWMRQWLLDYQLPDGGWNCDEAAYSKPQPKSSIVTTVSCLETILYCRKDPLTRSEVELLNRGADYLIRHRLVYRISNGEVIDPDWLEIRFPRFYDYDFLRAYEFLARWHKESGYPIPQELKEEVHRRVAQQMSPEGIRLKRFNQIDRRSYNPQGDGSWKMGSVVDIPLMKMISGPGVLCPSLSQKWNEIKNV